MTKYAREGSGTSKIRRGGGRCIALLSAASVEHVTKCYAGLECLLASHEELCSMGLTLSKAKSKSLYTWRSDSPSCYQASPKD
jgi:hypothetical protein